MKKKVQTLFRRIIAIHISVLLCFFASACGEQYQTRHGYGMGTFLFVTAKDDEPAKYMLSGISYLEDDISHRVEASSVSALNRGETVELSDALCEALRLSLEVSEATDGAFSPFVLPLTSLWNFDEGGSLPDAEKLREAVDTVQSTKLVLEGNIATLYGGGMDLGAIGKGMAADEWIASALEQESVLVSVGGSIGAKGNKNGKAWRVGVRDPFSSDASKTIGVLALQDAFVSTSGSYEKTFTENGVVYHHILDPRTGMPVDNGIVSVTVVAHSGVLSDILSTAVFAVGEEKGKTLCDAYGAHLLIVRADGSLAASEGMLAIFSATDGKEVGAL